MVLKGLHDESLSHYKTTPNSREIWWLETFFKRDHNPRHVWKAILLCEEDKIKEYPLWIREYLATTADNLVNKCDRKAKGDNGVVACLGFDRLSQLHENARDKTFAAINLMEEKIAAGKTLEEAAIETSLEIDQKGLKPGHRGYLGESKLEKLYRENKRAYERAFGHLDAE